MIFEVEDARGLVQSVSEQVELQALDAHRVRAVTHMDVDGGDIEQAGDAIASALESGGSRERGVELA